MQLIYKSGQGYWTRVLSAIGFGTLVLCGVAWIWQRMTAFDDALIWQAVMAGSVILFFGLLLWYLLNQPRIVDFMIATEAEMKKVNWPSRREIIGSTWIVIAGTLLIALALFVIDLFFGKVFLEIGILRASQGGG